MSNLRRSSWQEDIARNFSRLLFLRSKSQDLDKTETGSDASGQENEVCSATSEEDPPQAPELDLSKAFQGCGGEGDGARHRDAEGSASPPPAPGPGSPAPPLDAFFRRLGSLFHFPRGAQQEADAEPRGMTRGVEGSQEPSHAVGTPGAQDAELGRQETGAEGGEGARGAGTQPVEPPRSAASPEVTSEPRAQDELALEEVPDGEHQLECRGGGADSQPVRGGGAANQRGAVDEQQRRRALACPPVVTYGTYRGLREIKRMRKRPQVQICSPILEGEEAQQSRGSASGEEVGSPQMAVHTTTHQPAASEFPNSDQREAQALEGNAISAAVNSSTPCNSHIPLVARETQSGVTQSAFPQDREARGQTVDFHPGTVPSTDPFPAAEKDCSDRLAPCVDSDGGSGARGPRWGSASQTAPRMAEAVGQNPAAGTEQAETLSVQGYPTGSPSLAADAVLCQAAGAPGTAHTHLPAPGSAFCQGSQPASHSVSPPGSRNSASADEALDVQQSVHGAQQEDCAQEERDGEPTESCVENVGMDEEALQFESKVMVDNILRNALAALQKIEVSEQENETFPNVDEAREPLSFAGVAGGMDSCPMPDHPFKGASVEQGEANATSALLEDTLASSRTLVEGSRSTPSSGYESIAGSDTDIRYSPGLSCETTSLTAPISSQQGEQEHDQRPEMGRPTADRGSPLVGGNVCHKGERDSQSDNTIEPVLSGDESRGIALPQASSEPTFQKDGLHGGSNSIHRTNDNCEQPAMSESESVSRELNEDKVQVHYILEDNSVYVAIPKQERGEGDGPLCVAKETAESNRHGYKLDNVPCDNTTITNSIDNLKSIKLDNTLSLECTGNTTICHRELGSLQSELSSHIFKPELMDLFEKYVRPKHSQIAQERSIRLGLLDLDSETRAASSANNEGQKNSPETISESLENGHPQDSSDSISGGDQSFILVETYLASVVEDRSDSEGEEIEPTASRPVRVDTTDKELVGSESPEPCSGDDHRLQWSAVRAYRCTVSEEQSPDSDALRHGAAASFGLDGSGRTSALHGPGRRVHLDLPANPSRALASGPHPHRLHELDFHQSEGGFAIISEEEETDTVFVNDTGPMLSPTTRRGKAYPFSLSPIFEEESVRDEASMEDDLQVPPATGEDLRSMEQQASSILSLLQSVSERLQSSAFSDSDQPTGEDAVPTAFRRPLWDCFSNREEGDEDDHAADEGLSTLMHQQSPRQEAQPDQISEREAMAPFSSIHQISSAAQGGAQEEKQSTTCNVEKTVNTPFYQYLKSRESVLTSLESDQSHQTKRVLSHGDGSPVTVMGEHESFGNVIPRPTLMQIYDGVSFSGERREIHGDVQRASGMVYLHGASVRVLRGCWLLYLEPGFSGACTVLEEGDTVLSHTKHLTAKEASPGGPAPVSIGSIRRAVKDDSIPEIHLHTHATQEVSPKRLHSDADNLGLHGAVHLSSFSVKSGCWLAYDSPGFCGNYTVLEAGGSATTGPHSPQSTCVRSLRPLRMGGLKVRRPLDPKMVVYEEPHFQGRSRELGANTPSLGALGGVRGASSLRVMGGVWVGYCREDYGGPQYLLEEGECGDCRELGGSGRTLFSFRFLQGDFIEPSVSLLRSPDALGGVTMVDLDVPDLQRDGPTQGTASICVKSGVWVAYSGRFYSGDQYILEKGQLPGTLDWGSGQSAAMSIRPVRLEFCGSREPQFLLRAYSAPHFGGESTEYEAEEADCSAVVAMSFRVICGSWLLYDEEDCSGNQFVLGEGLYPDLISCGCMATTIRSLKPIPYSFSDPSISLFSLDSFEGLETVVVTPMDGMNNFFTQSLRVNSGLWVVYEYSNFKGRQKLLRAGQYPVWGEHSGWDTIGSLHPLRQPKAYVQVTSRMLGSALTAERLQEESSPANLSLSPACFLETQLWLLAGGLLRSKAGKACLSVIGGKATVGSRVALWPEHGRTHQKWSLNENGTISSHLNHNLVLDLRGGNGIDRDHLIVSDFSAEKASQYWDVELV